MFRPKRIEPGPGQESVWDYPRPPRLEAIEQRVTVTFGGKLIADTTGALRILETSHPPTVYIPPADIDMSCIEQASGTSMCEWKGRAKYVDLVVGERRSAQAGWYYPSPVAAYADLKDFISFYPSRVDQCTIGEEIVQAQEGDFYGGWITKNLVGPFKGAPGTRGW